MFHSLKTSAVSVFFAITLFLSAFLVFYCEPMIGKMVLPSLGGAPSVWTTCVLFFQAMLLAGYGYAYVLERTSRLRTQLILHLAVMVVAAVFLPIHFGGPAANESAAAHPILWLLARLIGNAAIPFGVAVSSAPLLQNWLAKISGEASRDPYFLYSASNAGSLLALIVYPVYVEPRFGLIGQSRAWTAGYFLLVVAIAISAAITGRRQSAPQLAAADDTAESPAWKQRGFWLAASFVPSALMLAVTNHISANLVAAPFLWVIPLGIYLLTFILAFSRRNRLTVERVSRLVPVIFLLSVYVTVGAPIPAALIWLVLPAHIAILFAGALLCHTALAASRPHPRHLTEFYFWLALGGAAAGVFAVIIAPAIFSTVFEYPLLVATLGFFRVSPEPAQQRNRADWIYAALIAVVLIVEWSVFRFASSSDLKEGALGLLTNGGFVIIYAFRARRFRFALAMALFVVGSALVLPSFFETGHRLHVSRNFFGVKKVLFDEDAMTRRMLHGDTVHGVESVEPDKAGVALSYYHSTGPAGDVMAMLDDRPQQNIGIIGLGSGSLAAYANENRHITFVELDPQVVDIARNFFTYLARCGKNCTTVVDDGRLAISRARPAEFDLLIIDAFSSDSIPAHLVSREAIELYVSKLKPEGLLLFHVSNRYLDIQSLVSAVLIDNGLSAFTRRDPDDSIPGKSTSEYVVGATREANLGTIPSNPNWHRADRSPNLRSWTDDYSDVVSLIRWY